MNEIGFSNEFRELMLRHAALKERVANEFEMYMHYVSNVGPNIKAKYMMHVGCLECTVRRLNSLNPPDLPPHPSRCCQTKGTKISIAVPIHILQCLDCNMDTKRKVI